MGKNRHVPFGYYIRNGEITINPVESESVKRIFEMYACGTGYAIIAAKMTADGIAYHDGAAWNKHMVKRMLENKRYGGANGYPAIIEPKQLTAIAKKRAATPQCKPSARTKPTEQTVEPQRFIYEPTTAVLKLSNEINRALERPSGDAEQVAGLIRKCAAAKYDALVASEQE